MLVDAGGANGFITGFVSVSFFSVVEVVVAGAEILLVNDGALGAVEVGNANVTFFASGVGLGAGIDAFFSSSNFFLSFAIASASKSCFSHFEYDFDDRKPGEPIPVDCLRATCPVDIRLVYVSAGRSKGLMLSPTFVTIESLNAMRGSRDVDLRGDQRSCLPAF